MEHKKLWIHLRRIRFPIGWLSARIKGLFSTSAKGKENREMGQWAKLQLDR
jgi:hypothetical protein